MPLLAICERELVACGLRPAKRSDASALQRLTPQERVIARLVAEGRSNPEIAAELCVSRKTIEHHLSRVHDKLNVRGRTHMASLLAQDR